MTTFSALRGARRRGLCLLTKVVKLVHWRHLDIHSSSVQQEVEVQPAIKMEDAHNNPNNSSAYSSLTNSNGDVRSSENGDGYTYANNSAEEIRRITNDYNATLKKATAQIKSLSRERTQLGKEHAKKECDL